MSNIDITSLLTAGGDQAVKALISKEPIIPVADKGLSAYYKDKRFDSGTTVNFRVNNQPGMPVQSNVISIDPIVESEIPVKVLQWNKGVSMTDIEEQYNLGGMERVKERILKPYTDNLAVQAAILCYEELATASNFFGTPGTALKTSEDWGRGTSVLRNQLAMDGLYAAVSNDSENETAGSLAAAFNPSNESRTAYLEDRVRKVASLSMFGTSNIPNHTNGNAVGNGTSGMVVDASVTTGAKSFTVTGGTANGKITKNSLIYFKGGLAVQPNTKNVLSTLRHFSVAEDVTLDGSGEGTIKLYQAIYGPENKKLQNISALPVTSTSYVGIMGAADTTYEQALLCRKDSFAFVGLKLPNLIALENYQTDYKDVPIRTVAYGDGANSVNQYRCDMLVAAKIKDWRHVVRAFTRVVA